MAFPPHHFPQLHNPQKQSNSIRGFPTIEDQISRPVTCYNSAYLQDQSHQPPFHVVGFAPHPVPVIDGSDGGADVQWTYDLDYKRKRLTEQDFLEINSQMSSIDFLQPHAVSTGLGLSLDNTPVVSSGDLPLLSLLGEGIDRELQQHDAEVDRFLKYQGKRLRQTIIEKVQAVQLQTISLVEEKSLQKLREKEVEVEEINKRNTELKEQIEQLSVESSTWQQRARYNESMVAALNFNLEQVYVHNRDTKEGCGDSEVVDTSSCCNDGSVDFHLLCKDNNKNEVITCKACRVREVCMLLLPCRHLCLCKDCESNLSICPLCQSSKFIGMEVFMQ